MRVRASSGMPSDRRGCYDFLKQGGAITMMIEPVAIKVDPESELARALDEAESPVVLESNGVRYEFWRDTDADPTDETRHRHGRLEPDRVLNIIGLGTSSNGSDVANFKDRYIADAVDHRGE